MNCAQAFLHDKAKQKNWGKGIRGRRLEEAVAPPETPLQGQFVQEFGDFLASPPETSHPEAGCARCSAG